MSPGAQVSPTLPYAVSKLACERYTEFYQRRRRSIGEYLIVRFFGAYGPYKASHKIYTRLVRALAMEGGSEYRLYGDGKNLIDAMYVTDAVDAIHRMLAGTHWNDIVNLAGGRPVTIETLVREAADALGVPQLAIEKDGVAHERNCFWGSTHEMREYFHFQPRIALSNGIHRLKDFLLSGGGA
jgi:UDP-glucose 4-epimerase